MRRDCKKEKIIWSCPSSRQPAAYVTIDLRLSRWRSVLICSIYQMNCFCRFFNTSRRQISSKHSIRSNLLDFKPWFDLLLPIWIFLNGAINGSILIFPTFSANISLLPCVSKTDSSPQSLLICSRLKSNRCTFSIPTGRQIFSKKLSIESGSSWNTYSSPSPTLTAKAISLVICFNQTRRSKISLSPVDFCIFKGINWTSAHDWNPSPSNWKICIDSFFCYSICPIWKNWK